MCLKNAVTNLLIVLLSVIYNSGIFVGLVPDLSKPLVCIRGFSRSWITDGSVVCCSWSFCCYVSIIQWRRRCHMLSKRGYDVRWLSPTHTCLQWSPSLSAWRVRLVWLQVVSSRSYHCWCPLSQKHNPCQTWALMNSKFWVNWRLPSNNQALKNNPFGVVHVFKLL